MDINYAHPLRRLEAAAADGTLPFDYDGLMQRQAERSARAQRRHRRARGGGGALGGARSGAGGGGGGLVVALIGASVWRLVPPEGAPAVMVESAAAEPVAAQPRIVRADTY